MPPGVIAAARERLHKKFGTTPAGSTTPNPFGDDLRKWHDLHEYLHVYRDFDKGSPEKDQTREEMKTWAIFHNPDLAFETLVDEYFKLPERGVDDKGMSRALFLLGKENEWREARGLPEMTLEDHRGWRERLAPKELPMKSLGWVDG